MRALLLLAATLAATACATTGSRSYEPDPANFANPERGLSRAKGSPAEARAADMSLMHLYVRLDDHKDSPLSEELLAQLRRSFSDARAGGVKLIPRFIYNFPKGLPLAPGDEDAPLPRVLGHIAQLRPVLRENADVIAFLEAGFVGAWGEWHNSTSGLEALPAKKAIVDALLEALPETRSIALRYQRDKIALFDRLAPLTAAEAFTGVPVARVGHHNDCFLAASEDWGTYRPDESRPIEAQKAYLAAENLYLPQGGETCNDKKEAEPYIQCANALRELEALRWSQLNADYHPGVLALWRSQGCYDDIARRLGYRFRLTEAELDDSVTAGGRLRGRIALVNDGFAAPYNPPGLDLVLRSEAGGREHIVKLPDDPRRWTGGEAHEIRIDAALPEGIAAGSYDAFLHFPDPEPRLRGRPEYSIRLANRGVWEPTTGYNALGLRVEVRR